MAVVVRETEVVGVNTCTCARLVSQPYRGCKNPRARLALPLHPSIYIRRPQPCTQRTLGDTLPRAPPASLSSCCLSSGGMLTSRQECSALHIALGSRSPAGRGDTRGISGRDPCATATRTSCHRPRRPRHTAGVRSYTARCAPPALP
jgi:hypothetical protein